MLASNHYVCENISKYVMVQTPHSDFRLQTKCLGSIFSLQSTVTDPLLSTRVRLCE